MTNENDKKEKLQEQLSSKTLQLETQQNEFIEWLDSMLVSELDVFTEVKICDVLSKYKEIIGKNIDVNTKETPTSMSDTKEIRNDG